jgi:sigma-B regulation protein RsbU (phosphoserine phosphatase)
MSTASAQKSTCCIVCGMDLDPNSKVCRDLVAVCLECLSDGQRRELEQDLVRAVGVQRALLPQNHLETHGWQISWLWEPLGTLSGDHIDILAATCADDSDKQCTHLILGDVVGKGVAASLLQSHLHALFRALAVPDLRVGDLMTRANAVFATATAAANYATLVALRLQSGGCVELANAGHPRPLLADRRGVRPVEASGLPLGLFPTTEYCERAGRTLHLSPGDTLLLYTDGWTEAAPDDEGLDEYGIGRAGAVLRRSAALPLPELLAACRDDMDAFLSGKPRGDDLALVGVRWVG